MSTNTNVTKKEEDEYSCPTRASLPNTAPNIDYTRPSNSFPPPHSPGCFRELAARARDISRNYACFAS